MRTTFLLTCILFLSFLSVSCTLDSKTKTADCASGEVFDPVRRVCSEVSSLTATSYVGTLDKISIDMNKTTVVVLPYAKLNKNVADFCEVWGTQDLNSNFTCVCSQGICQTEITPAPDFFGTTKMTYTVSGVSGQSLPKDVLVDVINTNANSVILAEPTLDIYVTDVDRCSTYIAFSDESISSGTSLKYAFLSTKSKQGGTLAMNATKKSFKYCAPEKINDDDMYARVEVNGLRFVARDSGTIGNSVQVQFQASTVNSFFTSGKTAVISYRKGEMNSKQVAQMVNSASSNSLVDAVSLYSTREFENGTYNLSGARDYTDYFTYQACNSNGRCSEGKVNVHVTPVKNYTPEFSRYSLSYNVLESENVEMTFNVPYATDENLRDSLSYKVLTSPGDLITGCLGIDGSDDDSLLCTYIPDTNHSWRNAYARIQIGSVVLVSKKRGNDLNGALDGIKIRFTNHTEDKIKIFYSTHYNAITITFKDGTTTQEIVSAINADTSFVGTNFEALGVANTYESAIPAVDGQYLSFLNADDKESYFTYQACDSSYLCSSVVTVAINILQDTTTVVAPKLTDSYLRAYEVGDDDISYIEMGLPAAIDPDYSGGIFYEYMGNLGAELSSCMNLNGTDSDTDLTCKYIVTDLSPQILQVAYRACRMHPTTGEKLCSSTAIASIEIVYKEKPPVICEYDSYIKSPACGISGCISRQSPSVYFGQGDYLPEAGTIFYELGRGYCWKATQVTHEDKSTSITWTKVSSYIANQTVNEKDKVIIDTLRVDEGGYGHNDSKQVWIDDEIVITKISGDNNLLKLENIKFFYNNEEISTGSPILNTSISTDEYPFRIELLPTEAKTGEVLVTLKLVNSSNEARTVSFIVKVNAVSVIHNGWKNVQATGPKIPKDGELSYVDRVCNYSRSACGESGRQACVGTGHPRTQFPNSNPRDYAIYAQENSGNVVCYYYDPSTKHWSEFSSVCNISSSMNYRTDLESHALYGRESLIGMGAPKFIPVGLNDFYYDLTNDVCYRSMKKTQEEDAWQIYESTSSITIEWEKFTLSYKETTPMQGVNIYRRLVGENYNYNYPINKTLLSSTTTKYVDNATNSWIPPVPKTVYEYEIRPVVGGIPTRPNGDNAKIRILAPPKNMSLVHRWIANSVMCKKLHKSSQEIDPVNNYRCEYTGLGGYIDEATGISYYDLGSDLLVDTYEAGCPYTKSAECNTQDGTCIGLYAPDSTTVRSDKAEVIYYSRREGVCYETNNGGLTWEPLSIATSTTDLLENYNRPWLPPLSRVTQLDAHKFCLGDDRQMDSKEILAFDGEIKTKLPNKKEYMAYAQWSDDLNDSIISSYEGGIDILSSSKCNSNKASGLEYAYLDVHLPDTATLYSIPGTQTSSIRSMATGSDQTASCASRYGVQDVVGNVSEWVQDRMACIDVGSCMAVTGEVDLGIELLDGEKTLFVSSQVDPIFTTGFTYLVGDSLNSFNNNPTMTGPCADLDSDGVCESPIGQWQLKNTSFYSTGRMSLPTGMPFNTSFIQDYYPNSPLVKNLSGIGMSSGITTKALHDDGVILNTQDIYSEVNRCGSMATGGNYLSGEWTYGAAGIYNFELIPCTDKISPSIVVGDITILIKEYDLWPVPQFRIVNRDVPNAAIDIEVTERNEISVFLSSTSTGTINTTAAMLYQALSNDADFTAIAEVVLSGNYSTIQLPTDDWISFADKPIAPEDRTDVGFRCVRKVYYTQDEIPDILVATPAPGDPEPTPTATVTPTIAPTAIPTITPTPAIGACANSPFVGEWQSTGTVGGEHFLITINEDCTGSAMLPTGSKVGADRKPCGPYPFTLTAPFEDNPKTNFIIRFEATSSQSCAAGTAYPGGRDELEMTLPIMEVVSGTTLNMECSDLYEVTILDGDPTETYGTNNHCSTNPTFNYTKIN